MDASADADADADASAGANGGGGAGAFPVWLVELDLSADDRQPASAAAARAIITAIPGPVCAEQRAEAIAPIATAS